MIETICKLARGPQLLRCQRPAGSLQFKAQFVLAVLAIRIQHLRWETKR